MRPTMRPAVRTAFLAAAAVGALCVASSASAQSYGGQTYGSPYGAQAYGGQAYGSPSYSGQTYGSQAYGGYDRYAPPPPPPPEGQVFQRDDRYVGDPGFHNSDDTYGYQNYVSRPDTTPDDPAGFGYQAERERRAEGGHGYAHSRGDDAYAPPRYQERTYGYGDGQGYVETRRPQYDDRYDGYDNTQPPRYAQPRYDDQAPTYVAPPSYRGW